MYILGLTINTKGKQEKRRREIEIIRCCSFVMKYNSILMYLFVLLIRIVATRAIFLEKSTTVDSIIKILKKLTYSLCNRNRDTGIN